MMTDRKIRMSGLAEAGKPLESLRISPAGLAQSWAKQWATRTGPEDRVPVEAHGERLGAPLSIRAVAAMLGCSPWTVRQRHIPEGLPHFRSGPNGKLVFFRDQVVAWIFHRQQKGGKP